MGVLKTLSQSYEKSTLMKKLILILDHQKDGNKEQAYHDLFDYMKLTPPISLIIESYDFSCNEFISLSRRYMALGFGWRKTDFIPVSVFCFAKPLEYILQNRDAFDGSSYDRLLEVTYHSIELLKY